MSEPDALEAIARRAGDIARAIHKDLVAIRNRRAPRACAGIPRGGFAEVQEQVSGDSGRYLQLVQALPGRRDLSAAPMVLLTRLEGSLALATVLFGTPDIVSAYFDPSKHHPVARDCMEKGMIEGLLAGSLFLIGATLHRKGYLERLAQGPLSDNEKRYHHTVVTCGMDDVERGYRAFAPVAPNLRNHPYAKREGELLQWFPMPYRIACADAIRFNDVWLEPTVAAQVKAQLAAVQAAGLMRR